MKIKFFVSHQLEKPHRLAVHKSGKLGFSAEAAKALNLSQGKSISIGTNGDDPSDERLYMVLHESVEPGAFKVAKAGDYYYLPIKLLLDSLNVPYRVEGVAYQMEKIEDGLNTYYRLTRVNSTRMKQKDGQKLSSNS